ncbi:MAG: UDP-N-acetylmuramoyl-L-alanine--D-glutamate ligase [bacterium]
MTTRKLKVIVGLGKTGFSCARYLTGEGIAFSVMDDANQPPYLAQLREEMPDVSYSTLDSGKLMQAEEIIISPGVPLQTEKIQRAIVQGVPVTGDIAMFAAITDKPVIAITGSNGKSTVTRMFADMALAAGLDTGVGGNIGTPCLDIIRQNHEAFVLEVSSYQLEVVGQLNARVAVVLNLSPDHLDRYDNERHYYNVKSKIYSGCEVAVVNRETNFNFGIPASVRKVTFGTGEPSGKESFGIRIVDGDTCICFEARRLVNTNRLRIKGKHNWQNALAALAIGYSIGLEFEPMIAALVQYKGLPHRCEWLGSFAGVDIFNDSKSTNPGSTQAAVAGLSSGSRNLLLILGGDGKGADFSALQGLVSTETRRCFVYGKDREEIARAVSDGDDDVVVETDLTDVVRKLKSAVRPGDLVLFSPACASLDQFRNYEHRGEEFKRLIEEGFA